MIKVENVSCKRISIIDLNHYQIITRTSLNLDNALIIIALECNMKHTSILTFKVFVVNENNYSFKLGLGPTSGMIIHKIS